MKTQKTSLRLRQMFVLFFFLVNISVTGQKDTLSFLHITDLHLFFNRENYDPVVVQHREHIRGYLRSNTFFEQFLSTVPARTNSDFVIATGDIIDFFDAETPDKNMIDFQIEQFARLSDDYEFPILFVPGNHDIFSFEWGGDRIIPNQFKTGRARATWIRNFDCFRDGTYYSRVYNLGKTTYRLIFIDDSYYQFPEEEKVVIPYIDKPQLHWLRTELDESEDDIEIILMHIPLTEQSVLTMPPNELYSELKQTPSVKLLLSGHHHRNVIRKLPGLSDSELIQVETDALVKTPENWRLIRLTEKNILVSFTGSTDNELVIPIK